MSFETGRDVPVKGLLEEAPAGVEERPGHAAPHVVDHDVETTVSRHGRVDQGGKLAQVAQIGRHGNGPAAGFLLDPLHQAGEGVGVSGRNDHVSAAFGQGQGRGGADAPTAAGHDGHLAVHPKHIHNHGGEA